MGRRGDRLRWWSAGRPWPGGGARERGRRASRGKCRPEHAMAAAAWLLRASPSAVRRKESTECRVHYF